jgi:hypothetical protein
VGTTASCKSSLVARCCSTAAFINTFMLICGAAPHPLISVTWAHPVTLWRCIHDEADQIEHTRWHRLHRLEVALRSRDLSAP